MAGNDRYEVSCDGKMLPAMMHAMVIARNRALMAGDPAMQARFQDMLDGLVRQAGVPGLLDMVDMHKWARACEALERASAYHWHTNTGAWGKAGDVTLIVDGREYPLEHSLDAADPRLPAVQEFLERYAHVAAVKGEPVSHWRAYQPPAGDPEEDEEPAPPRP